LFLAAASQRGALNSSARRGLARNCSSQLLEESITLMCAVFFTAI
jgi:hypothetical protein